MRKGFRPSPSGTEDGHMEYRPRQDADSEQVSEHTSFIMRSVRDILAEEGQAHLLDKSSFVPASEAATLPPRPMQKRASASGLQHPPHMCGTNLGTVSAAPQPAAQPEQKARSLLSRMMGR